MTDILNLVSDIDDIPKYYRKAASTRDYLSREIVPLSVFHYRFRHIPKENIAKRLYLTEEMDMVEMNVLQRPCEELDWQRQWRYGYRARADD